MVTATELQSMNCSSIELYGDGSLEYRLDYLLWESMVRTSRGAFKAQVKI